MKESFEFWTALANNNTDNLSTRFVANKDITLFDVNFILKYVTPNTKILDLGSGTGIIINQLYSNVQHITAVEPFAEFSQFIANTEKIKIVHTKVEDFVPDDNYYDLLTFFGMLQYLNEEETNIVYNKYHKALKTGGKIVVKHQFGINEDVFVSGFSKELNREYASHYRHIDKEVSMLKNNAYHNVEIIDIYPPEYNRWENTHFYAIVAEK